MRYRIAVTATLALAGCGEKPARQMPASYDIAAAPMSPSQPLEPAQAMAAPTLSAPTDGAPAGVTPASAAIVVAVPKIAYSYAYTFRLPQGAVAKVMQRHVALCDALGTARCQLQSMRNGTEGGDLPSAMLRLRVATGDARRFGRQLVDSVGRAGGRTASSTISAEDVSKAIVDTEARLRQREMLVARLTEILRTRQGKVAELVEAERSVAQAQEEIDQARGWLRELTARVALSDVAIDYQAIAPATTESRGALSDAVPQSAATFVAGLSALLALMIFLAPWAALVAVIVVAGRHFLMRWRGWRLRAVDAG